MKKLILLIFLLLLASGCAQENKTQAPLVTKEEKGFASQKEGVTNEIPTEPKMKDGKLEQLSVSREDLLDIIAIRSWGFSVYDPAQGTVDYFTPTGRFLGRITQ
jgi:PBP1b-binding outer membrane lipoprotein LpoB